MQTSLLNVVFSNFHSAPQLCQVAKPIISFHEFFLPKSFTWKLYFGDILVIDNKERFDVRTRTCMIMVNMSGKIIFILLVTERAADKGYAYTDS